MPPKKNPHPGNDYYVDTFTGTIQRGYMAAQIRFFGNPIAGPFNWAEAVKVANASILNKDVIQPAKNVTNTLVPGVKDIGSFFHALGEKSTWIRVGEVLAGAVVLYAGLKSLTSGTPVGEAAKQTTGAAKKATNVIPQARAARAVRQAKTARRVR